MRSITNVARLFVDTALARRPLHVSAQCVVGQNGPHGIANEANLPTKAQALGRLEKVGKHVIGAIHHFAHRGLVLGGGSGEDGDRPDRQSVVGHHKVLLAKIVQGGYHIKAK